MASKLLNKILVASMLLIFIIDWIVVYTSLSNPFREIFLLQVLNPQWVMPFIMILIMLIALIVYGEKINGSKMMLLGLTIIALSIMQNYTQSYYKLMRNAPYWEDPGSLSNWMFVQLVSQPLLIMVAFLLKKDKKIERSLLLDTENLLIDKPTDGARTIIVKNMLILSYGVIMVVTNLGLELILQNYGQPKYVTIPFFPKWPIAVWCCQAICALVIIIAATTYHVCSCDRAKTKRTNFTLILFSMFFLFFTMIMCYLQGMRINGIGGPITPTVPPTWV